MHKLYHLEIDCMICATGILLTNLPMIWLTLKTRLKAKLLLPPTLFQIMHALV